MNRHSDDSPPRRRWLLPLALFFLAPEYLFGNQPITLLPWLLVLSPMYGGRAILVREVARRTGRGWWGILLLAAAYALLEEGPIDQMIYNPAYLGLDSFAGFAPIPGLGISGTLLQGTLTLHTVWSICVPIALIEAFDPTPERPWFGNAGLALAAAIYAGGALFLAVVQYTEFQFMASPLQLGVVVVAIVALIAIAVRGPRPSTPTEGPATAPAPTLLRTSISAFLLSSLYWIIDQFGPFFVSDWVVLGLWAVLADSAALLLIRTSRRPGWGPMHRLAVAGARS